VFYYKTVKAFFC